MEIRSVPTEFKLWLEYNPFDKPDPDLSEWDLENEFCNIGVELLDGRSYGINVWTYKYFQNILEENIKYNENMGGIYLAPPDLLVKDLTKNCIETAIQDLLQKGDLEWLLNPTVFGLRYKEPWVDVFYDLPEIGNHIEAQIKSDIDPGHYLFGKQFFVRAQRPDTQEAVIELYDKSIAVLQLTRDGKIRNSEIPHITIYPSEIEFWKQRLKNDIQQFQESNNKSV